MKKFLLVVIISGTMLLTAACPHHNTQYTPPPGKTGKPPAVVTPEPATYLFMGLGLLIIAGLSRNKYATN